MSEKRVVKRKSNYFQQIDSIHYDIENISLDDDLTFVNEKLVKLQEHLKKQADKIKRINRFDCDKVKELPKEIIDYIESFMYDDIDTICKAWCIRGFYINKCVFTYGYLDRPWEVQYITHIFKKYSRQKLWLFMTNHKIVMYEDWLRFKSQPKYFLIDLIYKAIRIDDFDWNKGLTYQPKYNYNLTPIDDRRPTGMRVLDIQYRTYQILKIVSKSPQPLT